MTQSLRVLFRQIGVNIVVDVAIASLPLFIATSIGSVAALAGYVGEEWLDLGLGFSSAVMIFVSFSDLLVPMLSVTEIQYAILYALLGVFTIVALDRIAPHTGIVRFSYIDNRILFLALAIAIHNIPEGMAVGVAAMHSFEQGLSISIAIALQDIPEGLAVAIAVVKASRSLLKAVGIGCLTGVIEYAAAFIPLIVLINPATAYPALSIATAFMMIYIAIHEIAPEIFGHRHDDYATAGFFIGMLISLLLEYTASG